MFVKDDQNSDFSPRFAKLMENRMLCSYHKYGPWSGNRHIVDTKANVLRRWEEYERTGNTEFLIDCANFCMMEWLLPLHPNAHFRPTDSSEAPPLKCQPELPPTYRVRAKKEPKKVARKSRK
jgi:hypothetical protein